MTIDRELKERVLGILNFGGKYRKNLRYIPLDGVVHEGHTATLDDANCITSESLDYTGYRNLILDLDTPHTVVSSSTKGHHHLIFHRLITREAELEILGVLTKHGLIQVGYYEANKKRGWSAVRLPWVAKDKNSPSS